MRQPLIVVTGGIASGKSTVARVMADRGGVLLDADELAHRALDEPGFRESIVGAFGEGVLTRTGRVSRTRLGRLVFAEDGRLETLNRFVKPFVKQIIEDEVARLAPGDRYIVLDAVLFFQYTFTFGADLSILTTAPEETRIRRMIRRDGLTPAEARERIDRQRPLEEGWRQADVVIDTGGPKSRMIAAAEKVRDRFLSPDGGRRTIRWKTDRR
ncbi:MAG: dephospho-CoA kinase [Candidatus Krumholzibacteriota bacterium]|nr:dephospho-CoA kinase [Candidatus Krumholzibacteriota bacterium]